MALGDRFGREQVLAGVEDTHRPKPSTRRSGSGPQRLEVEVTFHPPEHVVTDHPVVAEPDDRLSLGEEDGVADLAVIEQLLLGFVPRIAVGRDGVAGLVLVARPKLLDQRQMVGIGALEVRETDEGGIDCGTACLRLLDFLAVEDTTPSRRTSQGRVRP